MPYKDKEVRLQYIRDYKRKNRDRLNAQRREAYRLQHPKRFLSEAEQEEKQKRSDLLKREGDKRYRARYPERIRERKHRYFQENKKEITARNRERRKTNSQTRIASNLRTRLNGAIKGKHKAGSAVRDLGCSIGNFKAFIESKFESGMSWNNWGRWHLDHIIPLCKFNLEDRTDFLKDLSLYKLSTIMG